MWPPTTPSQPPRSATCVPCARSHIRCAIGCWRSSDSTDPPRPASSAGWSVRAAARPAITCASSRPTASSGGRRAPATRAGGGGGGGTRGAGGPRQRAGEGGAAAPPAHRLAGGRRRRQARRRGGAGRADPPADRPARPCPRRLAGAAEPARPGLVGCGVAQRLRAPAEPRRGPGPDRRAVRRPLPVGRRTPERRARRRHRTGVGPPRRRPAEGVAVVSGPLTVRSATRRLVGLTALRWLPVGLTTPITVLLAQSRGLSLAEIGLLFTVHGVVITVLELPTGGLADVLGRRRVVVAGALLHLASCVVTATAGSFAGFLVGVLLLGLGRALDSGPVEAWDVDTVHRIDPRADVTPGLARHSAADGGGLAVGAVVGGLLPGVLGGVAGEALALPYLAAAVLDLLFVVAVLRLLTEDRPPRGDGRRRPRGRRAGGAGDGGRRRAALGHRRADAAGPAAHRRGRRRAGRLRAARSGAVRRTGGRTGPRGGGVRHGPGDLVRRGRARRRGCPGPAAPAARFHAGHVRAADRARRGSARPRRRDRRARPRRRRVRRLLPRPRFHVALPQRRPALARQRRPPRDRRVGDVAGDGSGGHRRERRCLRRGHRRRSGRRPPRRRRGGPARRARLPAAAPGDAGGGPCRGRRGTGGRGLRPGRAGRGLETRGTQGLTKFDSWRTSSTATPSGSSGTRCSAGCPSRGPPTPGCTRRSSRWPARSWPPARTCCPRPIATRG